MKSLKDPVYTTVGIAGLANIYCDGSGTDIITFKNKEFRVKTRNSIHYANKLAAGELAILVGLAADSKLISKKAASKIKEVVELEY